MSKPTYEELEKQLAESVAHCELLKSVISPSAIDFIKCGIGGNYGGIYFDEKLEQITRSNKFLEQRKRELEDKLDKADATAARQCTNIFELSSKYDERKASKKQQTPFKNVCTKCRRLWLK